MELTKLITALQTIQQFHDGNLGKKLANIESQLQGLTGAQSNELRASYALTDQFMSSALMLKHLTGQLNVVIHAAGILQALDSILDDDEVIESASLGAGNTGRKFDLETNKRVAEFKFIDWRGGSESIRQNGVFKDFFVLAEHRTHKDKYLYVVDEEYPLKFFNGGRAIGSVLKGFPDILNELRARYGDSVKTVRDYYRLHEKTVNITELKNIL